MVASWTVDLHAYNDPAALITGLPVQDWMFNYVLNAPGAFEADFYIGKAGITEANLLPAAREIRVKRDGVLVWGGFLWRARVDVKANKVTIQGEGYFSKLRRRIITADLIYEDVNVQQIMWNVINHIQGQTNGDLLITQGAHAGGNRTIDVAFCAMEYPNPADAIDSVTAMDDGCDWIITPTIGLSTNKVFRTYQPRKGTDLSGTIILDQNNLFNLTYEVDASEQANWVTYVGPGDCNPPDVLVENTGSQTTYGLMQEVIETDEFDGLKDLTAHAREYLRNYKEPRYQAEATYYEGDGPTWGDFTIGDIIKLQSNKGFATINKNMRVIGLQAEMHKEQVNFFKATLDSVVA